VAFFELYRVYLMVNVSSGTAEEHNKWVGFMESRIRLIIAQLQNTNGIELAHPFPTYFDNKWKHASHQFSSTFFLGLKFKPEMEQGGRVDLTPAVVEFNQQVASTRPDRNSPALWDCEHRVDVVRQQKLPEWVFPDGKRKVLPRKPKAEPKAEPAPASPAPTPAGAASPTDAASLAGSETSDQSSLSELGADKKRKREDEEGVAPEETADPATQVPDPKRAKSGESSNGAHEQHEIFGVDDGPVPQEEPDESVELIGSPLATAGTFSRAPVGPKRQIPISLLNK
jgi:hypothetical protein